MIKVENEFCFRCGGKLSEQEKQNEDLKMLGEYISEDLTNYDFWSCGVCECRAIDKLTDCLSPSFKITFTKNGKKFTYKEVKL